MSLLALRRLFVLAYCAIIYYVSSLQFPHGLPGFKGIDLIEHFVEYAVLALLFYRMAVIEKIQRLRKDPALVTLVFASLYGLSDEIHQYWVPTRQTSGLDWMMDTMGASFVVLIFFVIRKYVKKAVGGKRNDQTLDCSKNILES